MKRILIFILLFTTFFSCKVIKVDKEPESRAESTETTRVQYRMIPSEMTIPFPKEGTEILFYGEAHPPSLEDFLFVQKSTDNDQRIPSEGALKTGEKRIDSSPRQQDSIGNFSWNDFERSLASQSIIFIDGVEMPDNFNLKNLSVEDIESISILKGEAAIKKLGKKGEKGIIFILRKKH